MRATRRVCAAERRYPSEDRGDFGVRWDSPQKRFERDAVLDLFNDGRDSLHDLSGALMSLGLVELRHLDVCPLLLVAKLDAKVCCAVPDAGYRSTLATCGF